MAYTLGQALMTLPVDHASLITTVVETTNRQDLSAQVPTFIRMAEMGFNRELRTPDMIQRSTADISAERSPLPSNFLEMHSLTWLSPPYGGAMEYVSPEEFKQREYENMTGNARIFSIIGNELVVAPIQTPSATLEMIYFKEIPALSLGVNWLIAKYPDLYLYATLLQTAPYLIDDERIATWAQIAGSIQDSVNKAGERALRPRTKLNARPRKAYGG